MNVGYAESADRDLRTFRARLRRGYLRHIIRVGVQSIVGARTGNICPRPFDKKAAASYKALACKLLYSLCPFAHRM